MKPWIIKSYRVADNMPIYTYTMYSKLEAQNLARRLSTHLGGYYTAEPISLTWISFVIRGKLVRLLENIFGI